jgi:ABC-type transport system involved in multi-copper enzyme maturation permease subunit
MIWLTWRQFRTPLLVALGLVAALAAGLVVLGLAMRGTYDGEIVGCQALSSCEQAEHAFRDSYTTPVMMLSTLLLAVPALIGSFWGAPLITRELETGTHRLAWTQSVTRTRWLAVKLGVVTGAALLVTAVFSLLLTWAVKPFDDLVDSRFGALAFGSRNLVPLGYAVFALLLGTTVGLLVRRTLPAMAVTLAVFAAVQVAVPFVVRSHLLPPVEKSVAVSETSLESVRGLGMTGTPPGADGKPDPDTRVVVDNYQVPDAWMLSSRHELLESDGRPASVVKADACFRAGGGISGSAACLGELDLHFDVAYHPGSRYWPFQGIETAGFAVLAALMAAFCLRRIPRGVA